MSVARRADGTAIAYELAGDPAGRPVLVCHGLADSRRCVRPLREAAAEHSLRLIAPDRPGIGDSESRALECVADWVPDAVTLLNALGVDRAAVLGISGGGPFAAACAAALPGRIRALALVSALGVAEWGSGGMAIGERLSLALAARAPWFGGWSLGRLAALARHSPGRFLDLATVELPRVDREALGRPDQREAFVQGYLDAFRQGDRGVRQDLRVLTRQWGFELGSIVVPTWVHHGDADSTVPADHARRFAEAIPRARLELHPGHGHFSLLTAGAGLVLGSLNSGGG